MSPVHSLDDLGSWGFEGVALAVLGQPIKHSISPAMHNAALAEMARTDPRFASWRYFRFEIPPADLARALELFYAKKFRGINLTVPHKVLAFDCVAAIDPAAQAIGAVNTLRWTERGWHGYNTDGYGLATGLREDLGLGLAGRSVALLGAGGAARGAAIECLRQGCASLAIANRTAEHLEGLLAVLAPLRPEIPRRGFSPGTVPADFPEGAIVINATSAGLRESDLPPIDLAALPRPAAVYDMIYQPPRTALLRAALARGIPAANGLSMLVHQGARALAIWTEASVPVAKMREGAQAAIAA